VQKNGSGTVGSIFGPIMFIWFSILAVLGAISAVQNPSVFLALNPYYAIRFLFNHGFASMATLSTVFLVLTGGEALYADMGHFGRHAIRRGWFFIVLPAIVLNYFGQGAYLLRNTENLDNPFYRLAPAWAGIPLVILATLATVIASQAMISGAFTITRQASQLGFLPRVSIRHTSSQTIGQIYVPAVNWLLLAGTIMLLLNLRNSDDLAGAYGISVATAMLIDSILIMFYLKRQLGWNALLIVAAIAPFLIPDSIFFAANISKLMHGGWIPLCVGALIYLLMNTWRTAHDILSRKLEDEIMPVDLFITDIQQTRPHRVKGVAVFLAGTGKGIPRTLLHNFKHNMIIHEKVVLLTVITRDIPKVEESERCEITELGENFYRISMCYGYSEDPDVPKALSAIKRPDLQFPVMGTTYFLGRETLLPGSSKAMSFWRKQLFFFLSRNAFDASKFFRIPVNRVVEIGIQVEL
jgi:KUP system potassium uptake protein